MKPVPSEIQRNKSSWSLRWMKAPSGKLPSYPKYPYQAKSYISRPQGGIGAPGGGPLGGGTLCPSGETYAKSKLYAKSETMNNGPYS